MRDDDWLVNIANNELKRQRLRILELEATIERVRDIAVSWNSLHGDWTDEATEDTMRWCASQIRAALIGGVR